MKKILILIAIVFTATVSQAQIKASPFKPLPKPKVSYALPISQAIKHDTTAWRFTPMAGYNVTTKQLMAGFGYGIQWIHFDQATEKYYTDFSVNAVGWVNGTTSPSLYPPNFTSFGITTGFLNQLVQVGGAFTPATPDTKSHIGLVVNLAIPLNN